MKTTALIGILLLLALPATAGTLITATSADGASRQIMIEGDKARINEPDSGNYGLVDLQTGMLYSVDVGRKVIMEFNPDMMGSDDSPLPADVQLKAVGAGPEIAGYATEVYQLSAGGQLCATHYLSKDALKEKDLQRFVEAFTPFQQCRSNGGGAIHVALRCGGNPYDRRSGALRTFPQARNPGR